MLGTTRAGHGATAPARNNTTPESGSTACLPPPHTHTHTRCGCTANEQLVQGHHARAYSNPCRFRSSYVFLLSTLPFESSYSSSSVALKASADFWSCSFAHSARASLIPVTF